MSTSACKQSERSLTGPLHQTPPCGVHLTTPTLERRTVEKMAEMLLKQGHVEISKDEVGLICVKSLDGEKNF